MKKLFGFVCLSFVLSAFGQQQYPSLNINLMSHIDPEKDTSGISKNDFRKYSGCWGWYQASTKKEYAIVGTSSKTYFIDITNPHSPVVKDSVAARRKACTWREIKNYENYCYVVSDDGLPNTFQIIDMKYLPDSVHVVYDDSVAYFPRAHTVWVDGNKLYVGGPTPLDSTTESMQVYSLANPEAPALLRTLSDDYPTIGYVHDMLVKNDTVYASCGFQGLQVFRYNSATNTFSILGSFSGYAESGYNHSSSLTPDGKTLVFCDETPDKSIKIADVTDFSNITMSAMCRPNMNTSFVGHNPYVINQSWVIISSYQDGLLLYNISNPANPQLMGYFDTYPQGGAGFITDYGPFPWRGNWGAYPFFPSGTIMASDMQNGIFLLEANNLLGTQAGVIETKEQVIVPVIYPNPASNDISISFMPGKVKTCKVEITNMLGQLIYSEELQATYPITSKKIDISNYDNGTYILTIDADKNMIRHKFIISK